MTVRRKFSRAASARFKAMKISNYLKSLGLSAVLTAGLAPVASAFVYNDSDLILVFRKDGFNDVEYNVGSISNYLGKANGAKLTVTNWNFTTVKANYNNSLAGVNFVLFATTSTTNAAPLALWLSDANLGASTPPKDLTLSKWSQLRGTLSAVGTDAVAYSQGSATNLYAVIGSDGSSYSSHVVDSTVNGLAPFTVESTNPATVLFYEVKFSGANPKPNSKLIGSFNLDAAGVLTFTAGPLSSQADLVAARITKIDRSSGVSTVSFTTTNAQNYRLWYVNQLNPLSWASNTTTVAGDGSVKSLTDNSALGKRFYRVEATH